jgi:hypothetical protein
MLGKLNYNVITLMGSTPLVIVSIMITLLDSQWELPNLNLS